MPYSVVGLCTESNLIQLLHINCGRQGRQMIRRTNFKHYDTNIRHNPRTLDGTDRHMTLLHAIPGSRWYHFTPTTVSDRNVSSETESRTNIRDYITFNYRDSGRRTNLGIIRVSRDTGYRSATVQ